MKSDPCNKCNQHFFVRKNRNILPILSVCILFGILYTFFFGYIDPVNETITTTHKRTAVIYARPTFHEEVVSAVACALKSLDYHVVVYIGNGFHFGSFLIPFTSRRQVDSQRFYGQCVSEWITIKPQMKLVTDADFLIFITYPMYYARAIDSLALDYLQQLSDTKSKMSVAFIGHRASDFMKHDVQSLFHLEKLIPRNQITLLTLSEHTHINAQKELAKYANKIGDMKSINLQYFYPILPLGHIAVPKEPTTTFSIQGAMKVKPTTKDPYVIVNCLRKLEDTIPCQDAQHECPLSFSIVGGTDGPLPLGKLKHGTITVNSGLNAVQYYEEIAKSKFMVLGIIQKDYLVNRATSSVPAAMIAQVPVVFTNEYLNLYPCLRDAPMHKKLSKDIECDAIEASLKVTSDEYKAIKQEIINCSSILWEQSRVVFRKMISKKQN